MKWRLKALCTIKRENPLSGVEWAVAGFLRDPERVQASEINAIVIKHLLFQSLIWSDGSTCLYREVVVKSWYPPCVKSVSPPGPGHSDMDCMFIQCSSLIPVFFFFSSPPSRSLSPTAEGNFMDFVFTCRLQQLRRPTVCLISDQLIIWSNGGQNSK